MSDIEILNKLKEKHEYYTPFIDKCLTILQFKNDDSLDNTIKSKIDDIRSMSELIKHFWIEDEQRFTSGVLEVLVTYRRKLRLD